MKCTECSREIKPIIAVDLDGTLGQYHEHFTRFASEYMRQPMRPDYDGSCEMHEWLDLDLHVYRQIKLAYRQGGGKRTMPPFPDARNFIHMIQCMDAEIWVTTTRPYLRLDSTDPDTRFWMEYMSLKPDALLYDDDKYEKLAEYVDPKRVIGVVDDLGVQYDAAYRVFGPYVPIQIERQSNSADRRKVTAATLTTAAGMLVMRKQDWIRRHA